MFEFCFSPSRARKREHSLKLVARTRHVLAFELLESRQLMAVDSLAFPSSSSDAVFSDSNCNGRFDQSDIDQVIERRKYLANQDASWADGDWNGDGRFDQLDLVGAIRAGHFQIPTPQASVRDCRLVSGDANCDGLFDQPDVEQVLESGHYLNKTKAEWAEGDFNGDHGFDQLDLLEAYRARTYLALSHDPGALEGRPFSVDAGSVGLTVDTDTEPINDREARLYDTHPD